MRYACLAFAVLLMPAIVIAQPPPDVATGSRVRISAPSLFPPRYARSAPAPRVGTVAEVRGDTLVLRSRGEVLVVPSSRIERLEVSRGRRPAGARAVRGMGIGFLTGVAVGLVAGAAAASDDNCGDCGAAFVVLPAFGAGAGVLLGSLFGVASSGERWERVPLAPRVAPSPGPGAGLALVLTHRF